MFLNNGKVDSKQSFKWQWGCNEACAVVPRSFQDWSTNPSAAECWPLKAHCCLLGMVSPEATLPQCLVLCLDAGISAGPPKVLSSAWGQLRPSLPLHHRSASPSTQSRIRHCSDVDPECTPQHSFSVSPQSVSRRNQTCTRGISRVGICNPRFQLTNINWGRLYPRGTTKIEKE